MHPQALLFIENGGERIFWHKGDHLLTKTVVNNEPSSMLNYLKSPIHLELHDLLFASN